MSAQKPPKSKGKITGFPYSGLWEEFGSIWESLEKQGQVEGRYEGLVAELTSKGADTSGYPSREAIAVLVEQVGSAPADGEALVERLYCVAAAYLIPKLKIELGRGAAETRKRLKQISQTASGLAELLNQPDFELEVLLDFVRLATVSQTPPALFNFKALIAKLDRLSASAVVAAKEIPQMPRGSAVNVMRARLMEASTQIIGDAFKDIEVDVKQADSEGRNPRPGSATGSLLFDYLDLVDPKLTHRAKVRLFLDYNRAWISVTLQEIQKDIPPKKYLRHARRRQELLDEEFNLPRRPKI